MAKKIKNLSPKFKIPIAEKELKLLFGQEEIPNRAGGLSLFSNKFKRGYGDAVFGVDERGMWMGAADFVNAPFRVDYDGVTALTKATITGMGQNFVSTLVWTATDFDTASWSSGTIKTSDGTNYSISAGNTGNIVAKTYVYLDSATSITVLQTSTTATDAAGDGKILMAIIQIGATGAKCIMAVVSSTGTTIDGDRIITGKIQSKDGNTFFDLDGDLIQIADENNTTIIDAKGLVSAPSFTFDSYTATAQVTTSSTSYGDVSGASLSLVLSRSAKVLIISSGNLALRSASGDAERVHVAVDIDGATQVPIAAWGDASSVNAATLGIGTYAIHMIKTLSAATHTIKLKWKITNGSDVGYLVERSLSYLVLGK